MIKDGGLNGRIVSRLVQMRRGGKARAVAIEWFETAARSDGQPAFSWWIDHMVAQYDAAEWDGREMRLVARRGFIKALDSYVHEPGTQIANVLARFIRMCIANSLHDYVRSHKRPKMQTLALDEAVQVGDDNIEERMIARALCGQLRDALGDADVDAFLEGSMSKAESAVFLAKARRVLFGDEEGSPDDRPRDGDCDRALLDVQHCLSL